MELSDMSVFGGQLFGYNQGVSVNLLNWFRELFARYPDPTRYRFNRLEWQYTDHVFSTDMVVVFYDGRVLLEYELVAGARAHPETRLGQWHALFKGAHHV